MNNSGSVKPVWHIHGEAAKYNSMVLGLLYYGRLLSYVKDYVQIATREYKKTQDKKKTYVPKSWVDYFLFGDVYIVGQGLDFSEMVLWWLICYKKQVGIGSITWFEPKMTFAKKELAIACNVCVETLKTERTPEDGGFYVDYYEKVIELL